MRRSEKWGSYSESESLSGGRVLRATEWHGGDYNMYDEFGLLGRGSHGGPRAAAMLMGLGGRWPSGTGCGRRMHTESVSRVLYGRGDVDAADDQDGQYGLEVTHDHDRSTVDRTSGHGETR